jgi:P63C domain
VDEATGYQYDPARDALAKILEEFIAKELRPWTRTFPFEFYEGIFRLKGWKFDPATMQGRAGLAQMTDDIVYNNPRSLR